jgi:hypothetical protein
VIVFMGHLHVIWTNARGMVPVAMWAYVTRFSMPRDWHDLLAMVEKNEPLDCFTDLDVLVNGVPTSWSLPKSCLPGDAVLFQLSAKSRTAPRALRRSVATDAGPVEVGFVESVLQMVEPLIERYAGCLVAMGRVASRPEWEGPVEGAHFRGQVFAPVEGITAFVEPVAVTGGAALTRHAVFAAAGPVTNRTFDSDEAYQETLRAIERAGNLVPQSAAGHLEFLGDGDSWMERINRPGLHFFDEAHLSANFVEPLLGILSDSGHRVHRQVGVEKSGSSRRGVADFVVWVDGKAVPVEVKQNVLADQRLQRQVESFTGPASLATRPREQIDHSVVLVVDSDGAYVYRHGKSLNNVPGLRREGMRLDDIARLRATISGLL